MIPQHILEKLVCFSKEEINNLNGQNDIDRSIFMNQNTIDYHQLLTENQFLTVRKHTRFCKYPLHKHNYIELMYVYSGEMTHSIDGNEVTIQQGELLLFNQNIQHSIHYCHENDIIFNFIIRPEFLKFLSTLLEDDNDVSHFIFETLYSYNNEGEYLVFKVQENHQVKAYIETIIMNLYEPHLHNELELKLLVGLLLTELMNSPETIEAYTSQSYDKILGSQILKYISLHYQNGTLADLSKSLHQPHYKICKLIKQQTNQTFTQLLQTEKLKIASQLLETTNMTMNDVIIQIGYENISYFYRIFKQKYGMTPHVYRNLKKSL